MIEGEGAGEELPPRLVREVLVDVFLRGLCEEVELVDLVRRLAVPVRNT